MTGLTLAGISVNACPAGDVGFCGNAMTDSSGEYIITGLPPSAYLVDASGNDTNVGEYYNDVRNRTDAAEVSVVSEVDTGGINFSLGLLNAISGIVAEDGTGVPLSGIYVVAYDDLDGSMADYTITGNNGIYAITGLPAGDYRVYSYSDSEEYIDEFYENAADWASALPVTVIDEGNTGAIDFSLVLNSPCAEPEIWHPDADGDTYGNPEVSLQLCTPPEPGFDFDIVQDSSDCNDNDQYIYPGGPPVRVVGLTNYTYYDLLQMAYDVAPDGAIIQTRDVTLIEDLTIDIVKTVTVIGGYECGYTTVVGKTTLSGDIAIGDGTLVLENFITVP